MRKAVVYWLGNEDQSQRMLRVCNYRRRQEIEVVATFQEIWPHHEERPELARTLCLAKQLKAVILIEKGDFSREPGIFYTLLASGLDFDLIDKSPWQRQAGHFLFNRRQLEEAVELLQQQPKPWAGQSFEQFMSDGGIPGEEN